jgi:hypothetical protein
VCSLIRSSQSYTIDPSCTSTSEVEGYELLIISFNHALRALRKINVPPLRESTDLLPLFQRNDLKLMTATLNGRTLQCTPYIILASLADTRAAYSRGDQSDEWADYAFTEQGLWAIYHLRYRQSTISTQKLELCSAPLGDQAVRNCWLG